MRTIYHLGLHKTGSTSLQMFLQANQQRLARAGILFPPVTPQGLVHFNADATPKAAPRAVRPPVLNDYMGHNALAYRMIAEAVPGFVFPPVHDTARDPMPDAQTALDQIQTLARTTDARALVLCSEDLARASLMVPDVPVRFADTFGARDVTLVAALRRPDAAIAAWQTQRLRFGTPFSALHDDPPEAWLGTVHLEYRAALEPWFRHFPQAEIHLLPYEELRARGGSVGCFGTLSGLDLPPDLIPLPEINTGLPHALLDIARQSLGVLERPASRTLLTYLEDAAPRLPLPPDAQIELFSPATRAVLYRAFADIHAWLGQVTGRWSFFADMADMRAPRPLSLAAATRQVLPALRADAKTHLADAEARAFLDQIRT